MNAQSMIVLYRTGFYLSIVIAVVGLAAAVMVFLRFDIPNIWRIRTGRAQRESVQKMELHSRLEGRMQKENLRKAQMVFEQGKKEETSETEELPLNQKAVASQPKKKEPWDGIQNDFGKTNDLGESSTESVSQQEETVLLCSCQQHQFELTQQIVIVHSEEII